jgi:hypothetical protein
MHKQFYLIRQNNSGGSFEPPAVNLVVEAPDYHAAILAASEHIDFCGDSGRYADYDDCHCCPCCGHRWDKPWDEEPDSVEEILGALKCFSSDGIGLDYMSGVNVALIKADGTITTSTDVEKLNAILIYLEE